MSLPDPRAEAFETATLKTISNKDPLNSAKQFAKTKEIKYFVNEFFECVGPHYEALTQDELRSYIYKYLEAHAPFKANSKIVSDIIDAYKSVVGIRCKISPPFDISNNERIDNFISFENGVLDINNDNYILKPHSSEYFFTSSLNYMFDPDAPACILWTNFLNQIFSQDKQQIAALQEYFGLCLTRITTFQLMLLLIGPKRSGKGTIMRVLKVLVGQANVAAPTLSSLSAQFGAASLINKTLAIIADARIGPRTDVQIIAERLLSITGEDLISVERKFLPDWIGQLVVRFIWVANELPRIGDAGAAFSSRLFILVLRESFLGRENRNLTEELLTEIPGIANWALEGLKRLRERGHFVQPDAGKDAVEAVSELGSPVTAFVHDECEVGDQYEIPVNDVYERFVQWSNDQGQRRVPPKNIFGRDLRASVPTLIVRQPREFGSRYRIYSGITLKDCVLSVPVEGEERMERNKNNSTYRTGVEVNTNQDQKDCVPLSASVHKLLKQICDGLNITVEQIREGLSRQDIEDIESGAITVEWLKDYAKSKDN
jgi:putative DNA primase/helicase